MRLTLVTAELESLRKRHEEAIATTSGEKAILRDAATRLNSEIRRAKEELRIAQKRGQTAEKSKAELERVRQLVVAIFAVLGLRFYYLQELTSAKRAIIDLERNLHSERARLHGLSSDNIQALKQKERILEKLKDTERVSEDLIEYRACLSRERREWTIPRIAFSSSRKAISALKPSLEVRE